MRQAMREATGKEAAALRDARAHPSDYARGVTEISPRMQNVVTSAEGVRLHMDFRRDLSGLAQGLVRTLERQGFVRVNSIHPSDLVAISKWLGREIGVLQSPYHSKLRLVLGTDTGVLTKQIKPGEVFVVHTHPVFRSQKSHFDLDIPKAAKHLEAVVDWSGQIVYFNKGGVLNPPNSLGTGLQSMPATFKAGFIDAQGHITGYAKIDVVVGPRTAVKVVE